MCFCRHSSSVDIIDSFKWFQLGAEFPDRLPRILSSSIMIRKLFLESIIKKEEEIDRWETRRVKIGVYISRPSEIDFEEYREIKIIFDDQSYLICKLLPTGKWLRQYSGSDSGWEICNDMKKWKNWTPMPTILVSPEYPKPIESSESKSC